MFSRSLALSLFLLLASSYSGVLTVVAQTRCGTQNNGILCPNSQCCSVSGHCGTTANFCLTSNQCQSNCINNGPPPSSSSSGPPVPSIDTTSLFRPEQGTFGHIKLVGYWSNWAQYRGLDPSTPGCENMSFVPENINPHLYSHLNYGFVLIANNFSVVPTQPDDLALSMRFNKWVHTLTTGCTTSFSVGGWSMTDGASNYDGGVDYTNFFSQMTATAATRATFIKSCITYARTLGFDGVDLNWEYVADPARGGTTADTENFTLLVQEMFTAFANEPGLATSGKNALVISVGGPGDPLRFSRIQALQMSASINWFNVMLYDFYGDWESMVATPAPIADTFNAGSSFTSGIDMYLNAGVPPSKINAGIPLYGRVWTLANSSNTAPGAVGTKGTAGRCTDQGGLLAYFEIREIIEVLSSQNATQQVNFVPNDGFYMTFDNQWVGFDDVYSLQAKVEAINSRGLRGAMVWGVDLDTPDQIQTKQLLSFLFACQADGNWPATSSNSTAEILCDLNSDFPNNTQTRSCGVSGTWGTPDVRDCQSTERLYFALEQCTG